MTIQPNDLSNHVMSTFYISGELVHVKMILYGNDLFAVTSCHNPAVILYGVNIINEISREMCIPSSQDDFVGEMIDLLYTM